MSTKREVCRDSLGGRYGAKTFFEAEHPNCFEFHCRIFEILADALAGVSGGAVLESHQACLFPSLRSDTEKLLPSFCKLAGLPPSVKF